MDEHEKEYDRHELTKIEDPMEVSVQEVSQIVK